MATLTPTLTLVSTDATSDALSITVTDSLTTGNPSINIARASVLHTAPTELLSAADAVLAGDEVYFYVKNIDIGLEVQAHTATCVVEYAYWRRA